MRLGVVDGRLAVAAFRVYIGWSYGYPNRFCNEFCQEISVWQTPETDRYLVERVARLLLRQASGCDLGSVGVRLGAVDGGFVVAAFRVSGSALHAPAKFTSVACLALTGPHDGLPPLYGR